MKKSLSLIVATAMTLTSASAVFADNAPALDTQGKFDALKAAGIFNGFPDGSAGLDKEMTRAEFAKVLTLVAGLTPDATAAQYSDVAASHWAAGYIGAASKAGLLNGLGGGKFGPSGKVTIEQIAKVADLFAKTPIDENATVAGAVSAWAKAYVAAAIKAGFVAESSNYKANAVRGQLVEVAYTLANPTAVATTVDASVTGAKKVTLTFNQAVDTSKAAITVKRGSNTATVASTTWAADKKSAVVELSSKLIEGTYDVTVSGLTDTALTKSVTVQAEKVKAIDILSDVAVLVDGTDAGTVADDALQVGYKVSNQYGEDITSTTSLSANSSGGAVTLANGVATIQSTTTFAIDGKVSLTLIHPETATVGSKTLTVSAEAKAGDVAVAKIYNANGDTLTADSAASSFVLVVDAKDQYGNAITDVTKLNNEILVAVSNPGVASVVGLASNHATFTTATVDGETKTVLTLNASPALTAGVSVVTLIASGTGKSTNFTVTVGEGMRADGISLGDVGLVSAGQTVDIPVNATNIKGDVITDASVLNGAKGVTVSSTVTGMFKKVNGALVYEFTAPATSGPVTLTAISNTNKVAVKTINISAKAIPTVITGIDSDVNQLIYAGQSLALTSANLTVEDQYGRTMSDADVVSAFTADASNDNRKFQIVATEADAAATTAVSQTGTTLATNVATVTLGGQAKGTEAVSFKLQVSTTTTPAWTDVNGSANTTTFRTVTQDELVSYGADDIAKVYNDAAYAQTVSVFGKTSDGKKVTLPTSEYNVIGSGNISATNAGVITVLGTADFTNASELNGAVKVIINDTGDVIDKTVVATNVAPTVNKLEAHDADGNVITSIDTTATTFGIAQLQPNLYVQDQYALDATVSNTGAISFADTATTTDTSAYLTISGVVNASGAAPTITNNGYSTAQITGLAVGDSFNVIVIAGGKTTTVKVNVVTP